MTTKFDPTTHKFGMAYKLVLDKPHYPFAFADDSEEIVSVALHHDDGTSYALPSLLTRMPEHDLIPRADVMELVKALEPIKNSFIEALNPKRYEKFGSNWHNEMPDRFTTNINITVGQGRSVIKVLENFNQKYGQITKSPENVSCADLNNAADTSQNIEYMETMN